LPLPNTPPVPVPPLREAGLTTSDTDRCCATAVGIVLTFCSAAFADVLVCGNLAAFAPGVDGRLAAAAVGVDKLDPIADEAVDEDEA